MNPTKNNPLRSRADIARAAVQLLTPLIPRMSEGGALIHAGDTGATYPDRVAQMEAFSRALWGIVPMLAGKCAEVEPLWTLWRKGLQNGVDPSHPEYWGEIVPFDQRMVEMAVMGIGMCLVPERFFRDLPDAAQQNLHRWLSQINDHEMPTNNWVFFRILVNTGFLLNDLPYSQRRLAEDLALVEAHYEDNGWYFDYPAQRDYYTPWGYHYYSLVYAKAMKALDPETAEKFLARSRAFTPQFAAYFDCDGNALPYGRSLTYRFAQGSFFAALALADEDGGMGFGAVKRLCLSNLRTWCEKPIFTPDGLLSIGYGYPNLNMAEGYNAPGSPYWGMKTFIMLALPESHPFWQAEETGHTPPSTLAAPHAGLLITRDKENRHVQAFAAGNHAPTHEHGDAKYEKFSYSTVFGFSVARSMRSLEEGAFDSMLALTDGSASWRVRFGCEASAIHPDSVACTWKPFPDVTVHTEVYPHGDWHIRIHTITTPRPLTAAEGGYAILRETDDIAPETAIAGGGAVVLAPWGASGILALRGYDRPELIKPQPNTNLMHSRTLLPTLHAAIPPGTTTLACAVLGAATDGKVKWAHPPKEVRNYVYMG